MGEPQLSEEKENKYIKLKKRIDILEDEVKLLQESISKKDLEIENLIYWRDQYEGELRKIGPVLSRLKYLNSEHIYR